ncbi:MAG TPA: hypothetical protein VFJ19_04860 [Nocardioidaceae bacterium]|nr:hypothetical protein [Nocardioidaceae bacterium]
MAGKVFFHIAAPKTGTTYLQSILWGNRDRLADAGLRLPGLNRRDHWWATMVVREDLRLAEKPPDAAGAWQRVVDGCADWSGDAVISNELFGPASSEQAARAVGALAPAEVHLVVTARNPLGTLTAAWQELLRYRGIVSTLADFDLADRSDPHDLWHWGNLDASEVLSRWGPCVPPERVHVVILPGSGSPPDELWRRFSGLIGFDPGRADLGASFGNSSMDAAGAEVLRRVNAHLDGKLTGKQRGRWIRDYLCRELLVPRGGARPVPPPHRIEECRARGAAGVAAIRDAGYHVVGDVDDLLVPDELPQASSDPLTDADVADLAGEVVAAMLLEIRGLDRARRREKKAGG